MNEQLFPDLNDADKWEVAPERKLQGCNVVLTLVAVLLEKVGIKLPLTEEEFNQES